MKNIILSLSALLTAGIASAQSYPKQPDRTVTYVEYHKSAKAETQETAKEDAVKATPVQEDTESKAVLHPAASVNSSTVSENTKSNRARRE